MCFLYGTNGIWRTFLLLGLKYDNEILNRLDSLPASLPACLINCRKMTWMWTLCFLELNIDMIEMQTYVRDVHSINKL